MAANPAKTNADGTTTDAWTAADEQDRTSLPSVAFGNRVVLVLMGRQRAAMFDHFQTGEE